MSKVDVQKLLHNLELMEQQSRGLFHYKREYLRGHIRTGISSRQQDRLQKLTDHSDYRGCVHMHSASASSNKKSTVVQPVTTPTKKSTVKKKADDVIDLSNMSDSPSPTTKRSRPSPPTTTTTGSRMSTASAQHASAVSPPPVSQHASHSRPPTPTATCYSIPTACRYTHVPIPDYAAVPTMTLTRLIDRLMADDSNVALDNGDCHAHFCEYCRGPPMRQRYALAKRLVQLELSLYGNY